LKVLWVKAGKLLPVDTGGRVRSYNILRHLMKGHEVTLLSYYGGRRDAEYEAALEKEFPGSQIVYTAALDSNSIQRGLDYLYRLPRRTPYAVSKFTHRKVGSTLAAWLSEGRFDVAVCDFLSASANFPERCKTPCVLFQHNVESSLWERMAATEANPIRRLSYAIESAKMTRYERATLARFHHVVAVSKHDREQMLNMEPTCEIAVVPTGVDTRKFRVASPSSAHPPRIVFTGSMDWEPNIDAVDYFCSEIWPQISHECPDAVLQIVGRAPAAKVLRFASRSVEVTGTVPSVEKYLDKASVVVAPLRIGGGTRLKIFEAMAMGKAVVSTSIGAEGLEVESGRDLLVADGAAAFAEALLLLLRDDGIRRRLETAAVQTAQRHDWSSVTEQFVEVLRRVAAESSAGHQRSAAAPVAR